ncbi:serine--tRNA ligase [Nitrosophilus kaiyonis]|uniref:serine--tRNA ligase n=1 Tax=Nitrosophilus kaiyonis TaxID=2930200 RepID=UPI002490C16D|nr:serine--tRNA ligase [Nitrosophilus kaiyonis]
MLDLKLLEKNFDEIAKKLQTKGVEERLLLELKELFSKYKEEKRVLEEFQAKQNQFSKLFGIYKKEGKDINELKIQVDENKAKIIAHQEIVKDIEEELKKLALQIPNIPDPDVPIGKDEEDNVELKKVLEPKKFDFTPKEHWELGEKLDWIDFKRGVKLAKSRFAVLKNEAAALERALINYMLDFNKNRGFKEVYVPFLVNSKTLLGTGQLPKFEDDLFKIEDEDLYLIPTAEVPLTNLYRDEIIADLNEPIKLTAYTPCFRKEAGSGGRDVRGMIRQHQFDKVELVAITKPEDSDKMFEEMVNCASDLLTSLNLPHRWVMLCTGDLGFSAAKTIDLEVWLPGQNRYREISSISNTRDFQARRAMIRYKDGKKNRLVHTLNGSSLAVGRTLIAIMENYQQKDGSIIIPEILKKYL